MELNKFLKIVWSINGVVILMLVLLAVGAIIIELAGNFRSYSPPQVIVGDDLEKAKKDGLILQGLDYGDPEKILHTDLYILPVSIRTYDNPERSLRLKVGSGSYAEEAQNMVNVIFLSRELEVEHVLLEEKVFIESLRYPGINAYDNADSTQHNITYLIARQDTNENGSIEGSDDLDLYISDLNGTNLTQVSKNVDIKEYTFLDRNRILISYRERTGQDEEHKKDFFALYTISDKNWKVLSALHQSLDKIKSIITQ